jgi:hypothetical protein
MLRHPALTDLDAEGPSWPSRPLRRRVIHHVVSTSCCSPGRAPRALAHIGCLQAGEVEPKSTPAPALLASTPLLGFSKDCPFIDISQRASTPGGPWLDASTLPPAAFVLGLPPPGSFRPCRSSRLRRFSPLVRRRLVASCSRSWGSLRFRFRRSGTSWSVHGLLLGSFLLIFRGPSCFPAVYGPSVPISSHPPKAFPPTQPCLADSPHGSGRGCKQTFRGCLFLWLILRFRESSPLRSGSLHHSNPPPTSRITEVILLWAVPSRRCCSLPMASLSRERLACCRSTSGS